MPDGAPTPEVREARFLRLSPQGRAPRDLGLFIEVLIDARDIDAPPSGNAHLKAAKSPLVDEGDHLIGRQTERLRDGDGRRKSLAG